MAEMALPWRARHHVKPAPRPSAHREPDQSVADVVHQLQDLTRQLSTQVDRLEQVNDTAERTTGGPR